MPRTKQSCQHTYSEALTYVRRIRKQMKDETYSSHGSTYTLLSAYAGGLKLLGMGADKTVYMLPCGQHVLKVGGRMRGWTSREIEAWRSLRQRQHYLLEYMAPVQRWSLRYNFMVQTYCEPFHHQDRFAKAQDDIVSMAADYGISDIYSENLGMLDSKLVIIDWGMLDPRKLQRRLIRDQSSDDLRSKSSLRRDAKR